MRIEHHRKMYIIFPPPRVHHTVQVIEVYGLENNSNETDRPLFRRAIKRYQANFSEI